MIENLRRILRDGFPSFLPLLLLALPFYVVRFHIGPIPTTLLEVVILSVLLAFSFTYGVGGWKAGWNEAKKLQLPILVWLIVSFVAAFWSPNLFAGLGLWRAYVLEPLLIFFILPTLLKKTKDQSHFEHILAVLPVLLLLWAAIQFVTGAGIPSPWNVSIAEGRRATGPFPFPNALALFVVPIGAWAIVKFFQSPRRFLFGVSWLAAVICAVLARSDGGLLALLGATFFAMLFFKKWRWLAVGLVGAGMIFFAAAPAVREPVLRELLFQGWSGKVRLIMWGETWNMLREHSLLGAGFGGYPTLFAEYHKATFIEIFQYPHNILFNFWSETGLFGVAAFIWLWITWLRTSWKLSRQAFLLAAAVSIAYAIHGLVDVPFFKNDLALIFWFLVYFTTTRRLTEASMSDRIPQQ